MYEDLKEKAVNNLKKHKSKTRAVYTVGAIFTAICFLLFAISLNFNGPAAYWIKFPIIIFALIYAIIYFSAFGIPFLMEEEISDEEIEREMVKIYKLQSKSYSTEKEIERLELKEIESLKNKWEDDEEYV